MGVMITLLARTPGCGVRPAAGAWTRASDSPGTTAYFAERSPDSGPPVSLADERGEARLSGKDADTVRFPDAARFRSPAPAHSGRFEDGAADGPDEQRDLADDQLDDPDEPAHGSERRGRFAGRAGGPDRDDSDLTGRDRRGSADRVDRSGPQRPRGAAGDRDYPSQRPALPGRPEQGTGRREQQDRGREDRPDRRAPGWPGDDRRDQRRIAVARPGTGRRDDDPAAPRRRDGERRPVRWSDDPDDEEPDDPPTSPEPVRGHDVRDRRRPFDDDLPDDPPTEAFSLPTTPVPRGPRSRTGPSDRSPSARRPDPTYTRRPAPAPAPGAPAARGPAGTGRGRDEAGPRTGGLALLDPAAPNPASYAIGPADADTTGTFLAPIVHSPGLDGLRALAVLAVIAYHAGIPWVRGGLLGVDTFFVLSGFLITGLLVAEYRATRRIDLKDFWIRRFRRLLPAALLLLLAVAAYARWLAAPSDVPKIRLDILSTLFYVANWRFAFSGQSYFDHFSAPSPLLHTWSLAVEEQFYVLWPLLVFLLMRRSARTAEKWKQQRRKAQSAALSVAVLGAEASSLVGLGLLLAGVDASKIYYGTEVRIQALLTGAALAVWRAQRKAGFTARGKKVLGHAGGVALLAMIALWATVDGQARGLYAGGFLGVAVIVGVLVAAIVEVPTSPVARLLSIRPLTYIGKISYGLYLWHWPILQALTATRTGLHGPALLAARMGATTVCTLASFYLLENPIRRRQVRLPMPKVTVPAIVAAVAAVAVLATSTTASTARSPGDLDKLAAQVEGSNGTVPTGAQGGSDDPPLKMLVAGDSLATTLVGSQFTTVAASMNMQVADASMLGCGVARLPSRKLNGVAGPTTTGCDQWPARFTQRVDEVKPDVAVLLVGRWEVTDQLMNGVWTHVGEPKFDSYLATQLDLAITTLSARGAKVVLFTTPAVAAREGPDGTQFPETKSERVAQFNKLLREAASRHPGVASISDLNSVLTPGNRFTDHIDGILTRDDGVHITSAGGRIVGQALLPAIVRLVRPTRTDSTPAVTTTSPG